MAQARALLASLYEHVSETSRAVVVVERRLTTATSHPAALSHQRQRTTALRKDLYEAHRLIDALHQRFPATRDPAEATARLVAVERQNACIPVD